MRVLVRLVHRGQSRVDVAVVPDQPRLWVVHGIPAIKQHVTCRERHATYTRLALRSRENRLSAHIAVEDSAEVCSALACEGSEVGNVTHARSAL